MSTEISVDGPGMTVEKTSKENRSSNTNSSTVTGEGHPTNGLANGYGEKHSSQEHKSDKDKQREKDKHKEKSKDKDREKERSKDKERHSSSVKDKDKSHSSSSSSKEKDRKHRDEKKDRDHKSSSSKDKDRKSSSSTSKDKDRHSSSLSKDKEKHSSSSSHRDKDKSSSSSSKEKHGSSSSSSKDKSKHSSSSDKKSSSSSADKHKSKDKDKSKSRDEDRHKERKAERSGDKASKPEGKPVKTEVVLKEEVEERDFKPVTVKEEPSSQVGVEDDSEEDVPLWGDNKRQRPVSAQRSLPVKREVVAEDSDDDVPLMARKKAKKEPAKKRKAMSSEDESDEDMKPAPKKKKTVVKKEAPKTNDSPKKKKKEEEVEVWKWWEEKKRDDGVKWKYLEHLGPMFADAYVPLPPDVKFSYNGKEMRLSPAAEEVATFYAKMLEHDYTTKEVFNKNFFKDWRKTMNERELEKITDLSKCNFKHMNAYFLKQTELRKAMTKEEKKVIKEKNEAIQNEYGFCIIDGHKEKIGNFRIEPPGLFRGRGDHPKMGMHKKRVMPEQVIINCSADSKIPKPPSGHKWKQVRHDNAVTWLASWNENVQGQVKYVMLNPSSKLKGEKDWQKYEVARELKKYIGKIRDTYQNDWKAKEMMVRQRAVALYFIDKLALRAGNEKDDDQADTVGCCSLRVEHISLQEELGDKKHVVVFDFLGKDSIRYYNEVAVEKRVFKNLQLFMQNKSTGDDLFDRLNTGIMNKHLGELMPGLSAKVFRTYNASITLQDQLNKLTEEDMSVQEKILAYNRANRAVAILCNHQRAVPKTHEKSMGNMKDKIAAKEEAVAEAEKAYKNAKREKGGSQRNNIECEKKKKALERMREQLDKLNLQATDKEENKDIALGTSKLNYLDPRISVAWCKKHDVPLEKVYNKTQRSKFNWAIDMATQEFVF